jgi:hypothetical protein
LLRQVTVTRGIGRPEALACGCRLVATELPGIVEVAAPHLGDTLELVPLPRLEMADRPFHEDLPDFVTGLEATINRALDRPLLADPTTLQQALDPLSWGAVFRRLEKVWERDL